MSPIGNRKKYQNEIERLASSIENYNCLSQHHRILLAKKEKKKIEMFQKAIKEPPQTGREMYSKLNSNNLTPSVYTRTFNFISMQDQNGDSLSTAHEIKGIYQDKIIID